MVENIIEKDIRKFYEFLGHTKITEARLIKPRWNEEKVLPPSFFVRSADELIEVCKKYNGQWNIYIGINEREEEKKNDDDVKFICNVGHDIDAHESGDEGKVIAGTIAMQIRDDSIKLGYNEPMIIDSGYGYWVMHHISPIENTQDNIKKIKEFGKRIKDKYQRDGIEMDSTVYNPSRIGRVAGTLNLRNKDKFILSSVVNEPLNIQDYKLSQDILNIEIPKYVASTLSSNPSTPTLNSFMDYCLTHELPAGERHKTISRHIALYISDHPDREILKKQWANIQKGAETELDQYLKGIDKNGKSAYPFSIGELVNFTKKYKVPFNWKLVPEYQQYIKEKKAEKNISKEIEKEKKAEELNKAIKYFTDKKHLAKQFLDIQPLYYDNSKLWWVWDNCKKCWNLCDEVDIMNAISDNSEANTINSTERNEILESLRQESRKRKPIELEKTWIQFKNKIVDIYTGEEFEAEPKYFVTNPIPFEVGESEDTPNMDRIFKEWVGEKYVKTLYEILAYSLLTDYPINRIFCFIGSGMNGKSKFLDLLRIFVGQDNCSSTELDTLISSRFEVTRLHKKLVCQMGETNFGELSKTSMLKKLSGGDLIGFEYKNKNPFEDKNYAKILISTNNLPATTDKTIGFYRRWMIIDFPNQFSEKKDILLDIPLQEYNCLAKKSLSTLRNLLDKREFHNEGTIEERMEKYESKSNFLEKFLAEYTKEQYDGFMTKSEFYKKFTGWCKDNRHREMSETMVGLTLKKMGINEDRKHYDWLYDGKGGYARVWTGIAWK